MNAHDEQITLAIADDHDLFAQGVSMLLSQSGAVRVVGSASNGDEAIELVLTRQPRVLLLDVEMPGPSVHATLAKMRWDAPFTAVIILTMHRDEVLVSRLLGEGAAAVLNKATAIEELVRVIGQVAAGRPASPAPSTSTKLLSDREAEVLALVADGQSNAEIGTELSIAPATVKRHVANLLHKLNARSRTEAIKKGRLLGVLPR